VNRYAVFEELNDVLADVLAEAGTNDATRTQAFAEALYSKGEVVLRKLIKHNTGWVLKPEELDDVLQEVFLDVITHMDMVDPKAPLRAVFWFVRCRSAKACRSLRRRLDRRTVPLSVLLRANTSDHKYPEQPSITNELEEQLKEIIRGLPGRQGVVSRIFLDPSVELDSHNYLKSLAELVSDSTKTTISIPVVRSALRNALPRIRDELANRGFWENTEGGGSDGGSRSRNCGVIKPHGRARPSRRPPPRKPWRMCR
jgi:DNA-directed RNA polymerase specialized sigma24 family protein